MAEMFEENVDALFRGMEQYLSTKTVVGEPMRVGDTLLLPLVDVSFGMLASAKKEPSRHNGGGGMGGKMSPNAILVIKDGTTRLINIKNADAVTKLMEIIPEVADKLIKGKDPAVEEAARNAAENSRETF